ncbi:hypothetical protein PFAG_04514 [Plasmodium falciparum Santa Lucia]|uniref:Uncharacterized protein n=1 Tax=Plasmodium falciparum Santa Lucia TaxID=478859 RepID=W7FUB0_PLAFA|nr:hypothetical protein PFAG_04514 [Plasmodium falciparum Santa Lucia]
MDVNNSFVNMKDVMNIPVQVEGKDGDKKHNNMNDNLLNFDCSYENILNNDIERPQEIDCGMSCTSSFVDSNEKMVNDNYIDNNYEDLNSAQGESKDINHMKFEKKDIINVPETYCKNNYDYMYNNALNLSFKKNNDQIYMNKFGNINENNKEDNSNNNFVLDDNNLMLNEGNIIIKNMYPVDMNNHNVGSEIHDNNEHSCILRNNGKVQNEFRHEGNLSNDRSVYGELIDMDNMNNMNNVNNVNNMDSVNNMDNMDNMNNVNNINSVNDSKCIHALNAPGRKNIKTKDAQDYFFNNENIHCVSKSTTYILNIGENGSTCINDIISNSNNSTSTGSKKNKRKEEKEEKEEEEEEKEKEIEVEKKREKMNMLGNIIPENDSTNKENHYYDLENNEIYKAMENDIINYKHIIFRLKCEVQIKNSYLENEKRKNEEYEKVIENYISDLNKNNKNNKNNNNNNNNSSSCSNVYIQNNLPGAEPLNIIEVENRQLKDTLLLKSSEIIELNNVINNLKNQKMIFFNQLENELDMSIKKETEYSFLLQSQTKRLDAANAYIEKQAIKIVQLKKDMENLENTYNMNLKNNEEQIKELLKEKEEFIEITKELEIINIDNVKKKEEIEKYKEKCSSLTDELNELLRIISINQHDKIDTFKYHNFYESENMIMSYNNMNESLQGYYYFEKGNNLKKECYNDKDKNNENVLTIQLKRLIDENEILQKQYEELNNEKIQMVQELQLKNVIIDKKNENYTSLLDKYNILEKDFEHIHNLCIHFEEKFKQECIHNNVNDVNNVNNCKQCEQFIVR